MLSVAKNPRYSQYAATNDDTLDVGPIDVSYHIIVQGSGVTAYYFIIHIQDITFSPARDSRLVTRNDIEQEISDLDVDVNDEDVEREHDWEGVNNV